MNSMQWRAPLVIWLPTHAFQAALREPALATIPPHPSEGRPSFSSYSLPAQLKDSHLLIDMDHFQQGGIKNFDKEVEAHEISYSSGQESNGGMEVSSDTQP